MAFERPIEEIEAQIAELESLSLSTRLDISGEIEALKARLRETIDRTYTELSAWERVTVARHPKRPVAADYVAGICDDFFELHGDRAFGDDQAMMTGFATIEGRRILLVAHRKGRTTKERLECNFGCAHPEGYRKALRKMRLAEKFGLPIVCMINTPGAYPGIGAEERGQAMAIAENILAMFSIRVPIVAIVIGEGGSGGALGIGVGDRVLMMEHAYYSVISPEGCAAILWKDGERSPDAAEALRLTSKDLLGLGVVDEIVTEPLGGAHRAPSVAMAEVKRVLLRHLDELATFPVDTLLARRHEKYRRISHIEGRFPASPLSKREGDSGEDGPPGGPRRSAPGAESDSTLTSQLESAEGNPG
ncbi:MAG TPA: acetyl-CoA carboxylase carboxyltransferase subunit alpha [Planctomycetes bacterium]|nr:acetyl-CoA carboxylase carboxyltransferase subunit alpha [Planctomycetota bacterium]